MGGCISHPRALAHRSRTSLSAAASAQLSPQEVGVLQLIFEDLALRAVSREISMENFILFFHKNGLWGERLFREFDATDDNQISQEEFITGIARIGKGSQRERIRLMFRFFSQQHGDANNEGIFFSEFVKMLYNYPKEDLKEVLNDRDFIEYELSRRGRKAQGRSSQISRLKRAETSAIPIESSMLRMTRRISQDDRASESHRDDDREMSSIVAEQIINNAKQYQPQHTTIKLRAGDAFCDIKTINIQQVVRKFALKIFRDAGVNPVSGKLNFDQFYQWISVHRVLFQNYYDGFHAEVWELDTEAKVPRFLTSTPEKDSQARLQTESGPLDVRIRLFHGVLVAWRQGQKEAVAVVCLQGLAVQKVFDTNSGFGLSFNHRDRIYPQRRVYFRNQKLANEWVDLLRFYRGQSIHEKYTIGGKIGTGKFSVVYKCKHNFELKEYAVKEIATFKLDAQALQLIAHQSSIMQVIQHPLLLSFKECLQTRKHIYIITEYVPGVNLFEEVRDYQTLQDYDAAKITQMIIVGISYLHSLQIVHRDLKPENIMIMECSDTREIDLIKIIDFGFSDHLSHLKSRHNTEMICGTPNYIAPEVLREEGVGFKSDNFAIGVIIYYMLTGNLPFNDYSIPQILKNTLEGQFSYPALIPISNHAKDLINRFLDVDPEQRISLHDALRHPWFEQLKQPRKTPRKQKPKSSIFGVFQ